MVKFPATLVGISEAFPSKDKTKMFMNINVNAPGPSNEKGQVSAQFLIEAKNFSEGTKPGTYPRRCNLLLDVNLARGMVRAVGCEAE